GSDGRPSRVGGLAGGRQFGCGGAVRGRPRLAARLLVGRRVGRLVAPVEQFRELLAPHDNLPVRAVPSAEVEIPRHDPAALRDRTPGGGYRGGFRTAFRRVPYPGAGCAVRVAHPAPLPTPRGFFVPVAPCPAPPRSGKDFDQLQVGPGNRACPT